jgi:uncharacterized phage protein (TIGR01671 family)
MTREIKFRDWDPETKEMQYFNLDQYDRTVHDAYGNIMQFTGLLDKNGKEIYEGDLLQYDGYNFKLINKEKIYQIKYDDNLAQYYSYNLENSFDTFLVVRAWKESKIIGNIYQNPELTK